MYKRQNWKRPVFLWTGIVIILFPILYWIVEGVEGGVDWSLNLITTLVPSVIFSKWLEYVYFSIGTVTTLAHEGLYPIGWGKVLASIETIFVTFMWAVFLVVFARKYMR